MKATLAFNEFSNLTSGGLFFLASKLAELFVPVVSLDQDLFVSMQQLFWKNVEYTCMIFNLPESPVFWNSLLLIVNFYELKKNGLNF